MSPPGWQREMEGEAVAYALSRAWITAVLIIPVAVAWDWPLAETLIAIIAGTIVAGMTAACAYKSGREHEYDSGEQRAEEYLERVRRTRGRSAGFTASADERRWN